LSGHLVIVSDAWHPQVNGVVRTLGKVIDGMSGRGYKVTIISPQDYRSFPCPTYPEIRLALASGRQLSKRLAGLQPAFVHIATEGPLGFWARRACIAKNWPFTTSFHTRFPEYVRERLPVPLRFSYAYLRWFHNRAQACLVPTRSIHEALRQWGIVNTRVWTRGVDKTVFYPRLGADLGLERPVFASIGRIAPEKNLEAFLRLDLPGTKLVVGDGPDLARLKARYPAVAFLGQRTGVALAESYACADVFVFPSRTDTFGLVLLEAIASGVPVAAFPVPGPLDVIGATGAGVLSEDLHAAALGALAMGRIDPDTCLSGFTWDRCVDLFEETIVEIGRKSENAVVPAAAEA
jgi:glycosyltransferase involved in cell wall biosynthesis